MKYAYTYVVKIYQTVINFISFHAFLVANIKTKMSLIGLYSFYHFKGGVGPIWSSGSKRSLFIVLKMVVVCLQALRAETHSILMGPVSNKMLKPGFKSLCMLALWSMEIINSSKKSSVPLVKVQIFKKLHNKEQI